jgi:hypothetical protein
MNLSPMIDFFEDCSLSQINENVSYRELSKYF